MATIKLLPSTYSLSNTSYLSISNASNIYTDTDSTTYATITNSRTNTTSYYIYIKGFDFSSMPDDVTVNSFTVKLKARESGVSTSTTYAPLLCNNTTTISSTTASTTLSTTASTITIPTGSLTWNDLVTYGSNFAIRVVNRRSSSNTTGYVYIYGAEIEVDYTPNVYYDITTSTSSENITIDPLGTTSVIQEKSFTVSLSPVNSVTSITDNGTDVTSNLVLHQDSGGSVTNTLGTYTLVSGGFSSSGATYFSSIVGNGYDTSTTTTSNYYSSSSSTNAVFQYDVSFSDIPSNATITNVYMMANGHAESTSNSSEYMCVQLKSGSTELSEQYNFKDAGTSNTTQTITCTTIPTVGQLSNLVVECTLGYYGGAINGVTVFVEYTLPAIIEWYTYTITGVAEDHVIIIYSGTSGTNLYIQLNNSMKQVMKVYQKTNGTWEEMTDLESYFTAGRKFQRGIKEVENG